MATTISTPWGPSQTITPYTPWLFFVSTSGHGGCKVDAAHNRLIPSIARRPGGWYEEDCEWSIPFVALGDAITRDLLPENARGARLPETMAAADETLRNWYPDEYAAITGVTLTPESSMVLRERAAAAFAVETGAFIVCSAFGEWAEDVPDGMVGLYLRRGTRDGEERRVLIPAARYQPRPYDPTDPLSAGKYFTAADVATFAEWRS